MQIVFVAQHPAEAHFVRGLLDSVGIESEVRREALFTTMKAAAVIPDCLPEVWVWNDAQVPLALDLVSRYSRGEAIVQSDGIPWQCPKCGEELEPQFTSCWKCSTAKPERVPAV